MKKTIKLKGLIALAAIIGWGMVALSLTGCDTGGGGTSLSAPEHVRIDADTFTLHWDDVNGASEYKVYINGEIKTVDASRTSYDLKALTVDPVATTLKVKAAAPGDESSYSTELECEPALYVFEFDNNGASPSVQFAGNARAAGPAGAAAGSRITGLTTYGKTLDTVVIPAKVGAVDITTIASNAFADNDILANIVIATSITTIGDGAFSNCTVLVVVVFLSETPPAMGDDIFYGSPAIENIHVPDGADGAYENALPDDITDKITEEEPPEIIVPDPPVGPGAGPNTITITGLAAWNGRAAAVQIQNKNDEDDMGVGEGTIANGQLVIRSYINGEPVEAGHNPAAWTPRANGNYLLFLLIGSTDADDDEGFEAAYLYTNGQSLAQLGIDPDAIDWDDLISKVPAFTFSASGAVFDLNKFVDATDFVGEAGEGWSLEVAELEKILNITIGPNVTTWGQLATAKGYSNYQLLTQFIEGYYRDLYESEGHTVHFVNVYTLDRNSSSEWNPLPVTANTLLNNIHVEIQYRSGGGNSGGPGIPPDDGGTFITITDISNNLNGFRAEISVFTTDGDDFSEGGGNIYNGQVTVEMLLYDDDEVWVDDGKGGYWDHQVWAWTPKAGQGYIMSLHIEGMTSTSDYVNNLYLYTDGKTLQQLGVTLDADGKIADWDDFESKIPAYAFAGSSVTIPFNQFLDVTDIMEDAPWGAAEEISLDVETLEKVLSVIKKDADFTIGSTVTTWSGVAQAAGYTSYTDLNKAIEDYYRQQYEDDGYMVEDVSIRTFDSTNKPSEVNANTPLVDTGGNANIWISIEYMGYGGGGYDDGDDDPNNPNGGKG